MESNSWQRETANHSSSSSSTLSPEQSPPRQTCLSRSEWRPVFARNAEPLGEVCFENATRVFCSSDQAIARTTCDADIHVRVPLAFRRDGVPIRERLLEQVAATGFRETTGVDDERLKEQPVFHTVVAVEEAGLLRSEVDSRHQIGNLPEGWAELPFVQVLPVERHHLPGDQDSLEEDELDTERFEAIENNKETNLASLVQVVCSGERRGGEFAEWAVVHKRASDVVNIGKPIAQIPLQNGIALPATAVQIPACSTPQHSGFASGYAPVWRESVPVAMNRNYASPFRHTSLDRKARVARYLEKKKKRTWKNRIRYHSRKAYAENRPRIKGRFVKPEEFEAYVKGQEESLKE